MKAFSILEKAVSILEKARKSKPFTLSVLCITCVLMSCQGDLCIVSHQEKRKHSSVSVLKSISSLNSDLV